MGQLYHVDNGGMALPCRQVRTTNEATELQDVLARNLFLLPGDQINPEAPRRWMLIRQEMPVPDPGGGGSRWSVDLLVSDQDGVPTFVECKRYADTRSRREVVGQMLEYAANGHYYWDHADIRRYMEESADRAGHSLSELFKALGSEGADSIDELIEKIIENLREGQVRLVFFMEEAPQELKSIVDFLNRQIERTEVLIVEARQFEALGERFVVPSLFGYTEEARRAKRTVTVESGRQHRRWDEESFLAEVSADLGKEKSEISFGLLACGREYDLEIRWGKGRRRGSLTLVAPALCSSSFLSVYTDGELVFNMGLLRGSTAAERLRAELESGVAERLGLDPRGPEAVYWSYKIDEWFPQGRSLVPLIEEVVSGQHRSGPDQELLSTE